MNTSPKVLAPLLVFALLLPQAVLAQQGGTTLEKLREQVARLEAIDRDPGAAPEVRELNVPFLARRRAELRDTLGRRVKALETYLSSADSALSPKEAGAIRETVEALRGELAALEGDDRAGASLAESSSAHAARTPAPVEVASLKLPALPSQRAVRESASADAASFTGSLMAMPQAATAAPTCEPVSDSDEVTYTVNKQLGDNTNSYMNYFDANGSVQAAQIDNLITATLYPSPTHAENDDYAIVHVIKWEKIEKKYEALRDRWALYKYVTKPDAGKTHWQKQTTFKGTRIYGRERVHVLVVHFVPFEDAETGLNRWDINYKVSVTKKRPANVANALTLLGAITTPPAALAGGPAKVKAVWGGGLMCVKDVPSDIVADAEVIPRDFNSAQAVQQPKTYSKTYDNEGRYWWDVSIGVPLKEIKEVQYDASEGVVRAKEVNRQNAYGFLNLFFRPVDVKEENFLKVPHLVLGVPISKKPLDSPIVGLGYGIRKFDIKFDFYAGAVFNRVREPRNLGVGESATQGELEGDLRSKRVTKFVFGVNFPLKQVKDAISK